VGSEVDLSEVRDGLVGGCVMSKDKVLKNGSQYTTDVYDERKH